MLYDVAGLIWLRIVISGGHGNALLDLINDAGFLD
jgi:hypothetical protein